MICDRCGSQLPNNKGAQIAHHNICQRVPKPAVLARLNHAGMSIRRIAAIYGISHAFVKRRIQGAGLKVVDTRRMKWSKTKRLEHLPKWAPRPESYVEPDPDETPCPDCGMLHSEPECPACAAEAQRRETRQRRERELALWRERQRQLKHERGALQRCGVRRNYA